MAQTPDPTAQRSVQQQIEMLYATESRRLYATLVRLLGNFDIAEEALHDAFAAALKQWPIDGIPKNPGPWLVSTGRFKAIDSLRRRARFTTSLDTVIDQVESIIGDDGDWDSELIEDDQLRLIFTCCHPALASESRVALTMREVCGLTTEEIARAFLVPTPTMAQRIVRAKNKIRSAGIPYEVPGAEELPERLNTVLQVIYLLYNEGYSASAGDAITRHDLADEAIRLTELLLQLQPEAETQGLLALMWLQQARRHSRLDDNGDLVLLADQDRSLWDRELIHRGSRLVETALLSRRYGPYTIQAAIAAVHAEATDAQSTDWPQIIGLYDLLLRMTPSPVIELNRAVAVALRDGPAAGLALIDTILQRGELQHYQFSHAARADMLRRLDRNAEARTAYQQALDLTQQEPERRFIQRRLNELAH